MLPRLHLGSIGVQEEQIARISSHLACLPRQMCVGLVAEGMLKQAFDLLEPGADAGNEQQVRRLA
jgi:hypothetical protein